MMVWNNLSGYGFPKWADGHYCSTKNIGKSIYRITVEDSKLQKKYSIKAEWIMPLTELFASSSKKWKKEYEDYLSKLEAEQKRLALEAEVYRNARLSGFGIFNFDKLRKRENTFAVNAFCELEIAMEDDRFGPKYAFCFPGDNKTIIKVPIYANSELFLDPNEKHFRMLVILPENKVAVFSSEQYNKINFDELMNSRTKEYVFVLETQAETINSKDDLRKLLKM